MLLDNFPLRGSAAFATNERRNEQLSKSIKRRHSAVHLGNTPCAFCEMKAATLHVVLVCKPPVPRSVALSGRGDRPSGNYQVRHAGGVTTKMLRPRL